MKTIAGISKYTYNEVKNIVESKGYELISDNYDKMTTKLDFKDCEGYYYHATLNSIIYNNSIRKFYIGNKYTIDNIKHYIKINNINFQILSNVYIGESKPIKCQCSKENCGEVFEISWGEILQGNRCPFCAGRQVGLSNCLATKNPELAKEWHPTKNGDLTPYNITYGSQKKVWWKCENEHEWEAKVDNRNCGNGCPYCNGKLSSHTNNLLISNPILCEEWDYERNDKLPSEYTRTSGKKVWWICRDCGYKWKSRIADRNNGSGCPKYIEYKGENKIADILQKYSIIFTEQFRIKECRNKLPLPFDFAIFNNISKSELQCLIEYQGIQHYKSVHRFGGSDQLNLQYRLDQIKRDYCNNNNIKLIEIPYWDFDNIEKILSKEFQLNIKEA